MSDLTEFLLARIAEDERLAAEYPLTPDFPPPWKLGIYYEDHIAMALTTSAARVLAECEAKRRIVDLYEAYLNAGEWAPGPERMVEALALPYADHPEYRQEWKP